MPIPPPTSDDLERDTFLVMLRCNGYKQVEPALIEELLDHPIAEYVKAGAHAVCQTPSEPLIAKLIETYRRRLRVSLDTQTSDKSLATMLSALSSMNQNLPELYLVACTQPHDTMLATSGLSALEHMKHPQTAAMAQRLLADPREYVRGTAAGVLARVAPQSAYEELLTQLQNPSLEPRTIAQTVSALMDTQHPDAVTAAFDLLVVKDIELQIKCAYDLAIRRPSGAGRLVVRLYQKMSDPAARVSMLGAMGTLCDSDAQSCMFEALRHGSDAEAIAVIKRCTGYEPRPDWNADIHAAVTQRGDAKLIAFVNDRIEAAKYRDATR